jgi:hypothetical protein
MEDKSWQGKESMYKKRMPKRHEENHNGQRSFEEEYSTDFERASTGGLFGKSNPERPNNERCVIRFF